MQLYRQMFYLYRIVSYRKTEIWKTVDWLTIILYVVLVVAGWFSICGASYEFDNVGLFDPSGRPGSQLMWMGLSVGLIFVLLMLESEFFDVFAYLIYAGVIVLLIATIFLAPNIKVPIHGLFWDLSGCSRLSLPSLRRHLLSQS